MLREEETFMSPGYVICQQWQIGHLNSWG